MADDLDAKRQQRRDAARKKSARRFEIGPQVEYSDASIVHLIMAYLEGRGLVRSLLELERESGESIGDWDPDSEVAFIRNKVVRGQWDDLIDYFKFIVKRGVFRTDYCRDVEVIIQKQRLLETLHRFENEGNEDDFDLHQKVSAIRAKVLRRQLNRLQVICSAEEYKDITVIMECEYLRDCPEFTGWTPASGRIEVFHAILGLGERLTRREVSSASTRGSCSSSASQGNGQKDDLVQMLLCGVILTQLYNRFRKLCVANQPIASTGFPPIILEREEGDMTDFLPCRRYALYRDLERWMVNLPDKYFTEPYFTTAVSARYFVFEPLTSPIPDSPRRRKPHSRRSSCPESICHSEMTEDYGLRYEQDRLGTSDEFSHKSVPLLPKILEGKTGPKPQPKPRKRKKASHSNTVLAIPPAAVKVQPVSIDTPGGLRVDGAVPPATMQPDSRQENAGVPWQHAKNDRQRGEISLQAEEVSLPDGQGEEFQRMEDKAQVSHAAEEKMDSNSDEQEMAGDSFFRTVDVMRNGVSAGGRQEAQLTVPYTVVERFQEPMNRPMRALGFSPGGKFYATGTNSGDLCIFDMPEFRRRSAQPHSHSDHLATDEMKSEGPVMDPALIWPGLHSGSIYCLDWSADGHCVATSSSDFSVRVNPLVNTHGNLRDKKDIHLSNKVAVHTDIVRQVSYIDSRSASTQYIASCSQKEPKIVVSDVHRCQEVCALTASAQGGFVAMEAAVPRSLLWAAKTDEVFLFDLRTKKLPVVTCPSPPVFRPRVALKHCPFGTNSIKSQITCLSTSSNFICTGFASGHCAAMDVRSHTWLGPVAVHNGECRSVHCSPVEVGRILSCGFDNRICTSEFIHHRHRPWGWNIGLVGRLGNRVVNARWNHQGTYMLTSSLDKRLRLWRTDLPLA